MQPTSGGIAEQQGEVLPDHTQLPESDGAIVENFQEHPQGELLTSSLTPRLHELHPDDQYCIGHDSGIYWRYTQPVLDGCKSPDWFYVPDVPPMLEGQYRRSYVLWKEAVRPLLIIEFVSGDGSDERDRTPYRGKFWVYEKAIGAAYYAILEVQKGTVELYKLNGGKYHLVEPNAAGRYPIGELRVELGIWQGRHRNMEMPWLRLWDTETGQLLPSAEERGELHRKRAENEKRRAETAESLLDDAKRRLEEECERAENERRERENERRRAEELAERLRAAGIDPDAP